MLAARCKERDVMSNLGLAEGPQHAPIPELEIESSDRAIRVISSHWQCKTMFAKGLESRQHRSRQVSFIGISFSCVCITGSILANPCGTACLVADTWAEPLQSGRPNDSQKSSFPTPTTLFQDPQLQDVASTLLYPPAP